MYKYCQTRCQDRRLLYRQSVQAEQRKLCPALFDLLPTTVPESYSETRSLVSALDGVGYKCNGKWSIIGHPCSWRNYIPYFASAYDVLTCQCKSALRCQSRLQPATTLANSRPTLRSIKAYVLQCYRYTPDLKSALSKLRMLSCSCQGIK